VDVMGGSDGSSEDESSLMETGWDKNQVTSRLGPKIVGPHTFNYQRSFP